MSISIRYLRRNETGVAFILVIGVLAGLLVLAAPFLAVALNDREVARKVVAEAEVAAYADGVQKYARIALERSHAYRETANGRDPAADIFSTPKWDTAPEFDVPLDMVDGSGKPLVGSDGKPLLVRDDPRGLLLDLTVRDEQSLPNLWASSPFLIAAYLGRGTLTADVEPTATELALDVGDGFPLKNGALLIEGERITYTERVGGSFKGLGRASPPSGRARKLRAETWAIDDRAREIAMLPWKSPRASGGFREPLSASAAKEIVLGGSGILTPVEADRIGRHFNVASHRYMAEGFGLARSMTSTFDPATADVTDGFKMRVENNDGINAGSVVRISDGVNVDYGYVLRSDRGGGQFATLTLIEAPRSAYVEGRTQVAPLVRNRININSCSEDLLKTLILGNQLTGGRFGQGSQGRVTSAGAKFFVDDIIAARPIRGWDELRNVLQQTVETWPLVTDGSQLQAIFRNAVDSGDWLLSNTTAPFCFRSGDYFSNETAASKNDLSGRELARIRIRELSRVSPPVSQVVRIDSQEEFEESILFARQSPYFTTFPNPVESYEQGGETPQSRVGRMLLFSANSGESKQAGVFPHKIEGDVRMWPARLNELGGYSEHFDGQAFQQPSNVDVLRVDADGWLLDGGAFELALRNPGQGQRGGGGRGGGGRGGGGRGGQSAGALLDNRGPNPIKIDFWWKSGQIGGRQVIFDFAGANPDEARIQMVKEQDGSLRARVRDRTLVDPLSGFEETAETVFVPEAGVLKPETWYHLGMSYRGTKPEDVGFWIDGMRRGKSKYSSVLTGAVQKTATSFDAEDLTDWPDRGAAWIGREIVEFRRSGNTLTAIDYPTSAIGVVGASTTGRGRRGTSAIEHGAGEPVQLLGYSTPVASQGNGGGLAVPRGGGTLRSELGPFNLASFTGNATENINLTAPPLPPISFQLQVLDPTKPNGDRLDLADAPGCVPDYSCFQTTGGYALIVSSFNGLPANILAALASQGFYSGAELIYYTGRSGSVLNGVQSPSLAQWTGPLAQLNANISMSLVRQKHPTGFANGPASNRKLVCVFPISIGLSDVSGYFDPQPAPGAATGGGTASNAPEFVSLGSPDYRDLQTHKVEWIRYYHRDTGRGQLLCDEANRLGSAAAIATLVLAGQGGTNAVIGPWLQINAVLDFRSQLGTSIFGYDDVLSAASQKHSANEDVVPVFRVVEHPGIGLLPPPANSQPNTPNPAVPPGPAAGWGDSVTLEQANGAVRKRFDVTWGADADIGNHGLVSFGTSPGQDFTQGRLPTGANIDRSTVTRILKFPTGELPAMGRGSRGRLGGDVEGNTAGSKLDELRVASFDEERFILWDQTAMGLNTSGTNVAQGTTKTAVDTTTDEIPIANLDWILSDTGFTPSNPFVTLPDHRRVYHDMALRGLPNNDAGLVQIDDELIAFRAIGAGRNGGQALLRCERGFMNTTPQNHGYGANVVYLGFMPVSMLSGAASPTDREFQLASPADFGREGGLILIDDELAHYSEIQGRALRMPPNLDPAGQEVGGLLRGRFGTRPMAHDTDSIVVDMPFRHWDRYADRQDNPEIGWYGVSINEPGAYLESFSYEEFRPNANVKLRAFLRTEPDQRWSDAPGLGLLRFEEGVPADKAYRIDRRVSFIELRFMAQFESGSYDPVNLTQHEWKSSPELRSLEVKFTNRSRVLSRETER